MEIHEKKLILLLKKHCYNIKTILFKCYVSCEVGWIKWRTYRIFRQIVLNKMIVAASFLQQESKNPRVARIRFYTKCANLFFMIAFEKALLSIIFFGLYLKTEENDRFIFFTVGVPKEKALTILCTYISKVWRIYDLAIKSLSFSTGNWICLTQTCVGE